jgi:cation:H+ antiporter
VIILDNDVLNLFFLAIWLMMIVFSARIFINAVEHVAEKSGLTKLAMGAALTAILVALPESIIALVSPFESSEEAFDIGEASVIAAPSIVLLGVSLVLIISKTSDEDLEKPLKRGLLISSAVLALSVSLGTFESNIYIKKVFGMISIFLGLLILREIFSWRGPAHEAEEPLILTRLTGFRESLPTAFTQLFIGLISLFIFADLFIDTLSKTSDPFTYSLFLSPMATCLPETVVAIFLALRGRGEIGALILLGEIIIQSTLVIGVGMLSTPWQLPRKALFLGLTYSALILIARLSLRIYRIVGMISYMMYVITALQNI